MPHVNSLYCEDHDISGYKISPWGQTHHWSFGGPRYVQGCCSATAHQRSWFWRSLCRVSAGRRECFSLAEQVEVENEEHMWERSLNDGNKYELDLGEWITCGKKNH